MLQEAVVGGYNHGGSNYNIAGYNGGGIYNIGDYTMVAWSALYKQLYWEFEVSHNCICIVSKGPLIYIVTCLQTFYNFNRLF